MGRILFYNNKNRKYSDPIRIRAHHLLYIQGFQGYGYSSEFVTHIERIDSFLKSNPYHKLQIIVETDEICSKCPYRLMVNVSENPFIK